MKLLRFARTLLLAGLVSTLRLAAGEIEVPTTSPDGRFIFRFLTEDETKDNHYGGFLVVEKKTGRTVLHAPEEAINSFTEGARVVFSPDGSYLALNFRAGSRYETTIIYRWNGKQFAEVATPENTLASILETDKAAQLKEVGLGRSTYLRRIWDTWETRKWTGPNTAIVFGSSTRTFIKKGEDEPHDLVAEFLFTVRFEKGGKMKLLRREKVPEEQ